MQISRVLYRFLIGYLLLHLLMATLFVIVLSQTTRSQMLEDTQREMKSHALMLKQHIRQLPDGILDSSLGGHLRRIGEDTRFRYTIIDSAGSVIADSEMDASEMGDHGNRPEVIQAADIGMGSAERFSSTLKKPMMYLAITVSTTEITGQGQAGTGFIRVAVPTVDISTSIRRLQNSILLFALAMVVLTGFLMLIYSRRAMQPLDQFATIARQIGEGELNQPIPFEGRVDEWGTLSEAFGQMQDELYVRETRLQESNDRMQAVLAGMIEGVISTDAQGNVQIANHAACRMLSFNQRELIGKKLHDVIRYPDLQTAIQQARNRKSIGKAEFETLEEPRRVLSARVSAMSDQQDPGVAIVLHDVTDLRALETMRRDFVANVSHELKTPLASIKAYAETLRLGAINDQEKNLHFVEHIEDQADMLSLQIQDLIELARVESGQAVFRIQPVPINEICAKAVDQFEAEADRRKVQLSLDLENEKIFARADRDGLMTIVKNLLANAINYTPEHGSVVVVTSQESGSAVIEVIDTGIGIAADQQARVFERFFQVDKARSRDRGGTGLGLSIVKHLTQTFGGSIHLQSQIGKGSTFRIRLPLAHIKE